MIISYTICRGWWETCLFTIALQAFFAENILSARGIPASNAINMFYKQIILQRGLPFEVKMPSASPIDMSVLSKEQMNAELEKGYGDMKAAAPNQQIRHLQISARIITYE